MGHNFKRNCQLVTRTKHWSPVLKFGILQAHSPTVIYMDFDTLYTASPDFLLCYNHNYYCDSR